MPLKFHPEPGTVLICDFDSGFREPEMVKRRPVVVISPRLKRRTGLVSVVPLSTTPPDPIEDYHCEVRMEPPLPKPFDSPTAWVKADMLYTVGFQRLELVRTGRDQYGKRKYLTPVLAPAELARIQHCVLVALGLSGLTKRSE
ncbi:type II toxin-antitoxin system PemK/MazF family toxin [Chelatococcus daeguensis]|uniref:type II toxin-antitoxin system PemK/MazF family toxin n=1 Tax=Chelatococcus TaxID=28209 RepID=UPI0009EF1A12|nr:MULTISPECIES: type II toxin-antitoxin system PemK/MazF family toxin [Chelatococcus]MBM3084813.1 type II toxin-antitoxin system PemK/MazF family toxin [Chelatococcus daeguensis]